MIRTLFYLVTYLLGYAIVWAKSEDDCWEEMSKLFNVIIGTLLVTLVLWESHLMGHVDVLNCVIVTSIFLTIESTRYLKNMEKTKRSY